VFPVDLTVLACLLYFANPVFYVVYSWLNKMMMLIVDDFVYRNYTSNTCSVARCVGGRSGFGATCRLIVETIVLTFVTTVAGPSRTTVCHCDCHRSATSHHKDKRLSTSKGNYMQITLALL